MDHIVYISCKPTSLVRDLEVFLENGYRVDKAVAVDQFPWTANVETVVLLSKGAKGPVDLCSARTEVERRLVDSRKVNVDFSLENFNLPKSENARQPQCTPEKEEAIMQAFRHFGIV